MDNLQDAEVWKAEMNYSKILPLLLQMSRIVARSPGLFPDFKAPSSDPVETAGAPSTSYRAAACACSWLLSLSFI